LVKDTLQAIWKNNQWLSGGIRYCLPASVTGSGPNTFTASLSMGEATLYCASGARIFFGGPFLEAHTSQALHQASVSVTTAPVKSFSDSIQSFVHSSVHQLLCCEEHEAPEASTSLEVVVA